MRRALGMKNALTQRRSRVLCLRLAPSLHGVIDVCTADDHRGSAVEKGEMAW